MAIMERTRAEALDLRVVETHDGTDVLVALLADAPDVVVLTVDAAPIDPLRICREVADRSPVSRVLVQAGGDQAANAYQALRIGAWGCIDPEAGPGELHDAAEAVARGEALLPPRLAAWVLKELDDTTEPGAESVPSPERMTAAERIVLHMLAEGHDPETVGDHLGATVRVINRHAGSAVARLHKRYRRN
jgi:DNA-binding NarL/FixJ family response regulator